MEVGIYYYRARYFSATLGRFLQRDPIGYEGGINLYSYCGNSPNDYTDPYGLMYWVGQDTTEAVTLPSIVGVDETEWEEIPNAKPGDEGEVILLDNIFTRAWKWWKRQFTSDPKPPESSKPQEPQTAPTPANPQEPPKKNKPIWN
jgi:uncharacterized protein RhaS with RHS repeats